MLLDDSRRDSLNFISTVKRGKPGKPVTNSGAMNFPVLSFADVIDERDNIPTILMRYHARGERGETAYLVLNAQAHECTWCYQLLISLMLRLVPTVSSVR